MDDNKYAELYQKLTPLQQAFCTHYIKTNNATHAYKLAKGVSVAERTARTVSSRMLANVDVKRYIEAMRSDSITQAVMTRTEMLERLTALARTSMADLIEWTTTPVERMNKETGEFEEVEQSLWVMKQSATLDPIIMSSIAEVTAGRDGFKIKQHSPLTAMKQLAELAGYNEPAKSEVSATVSAVSYTSDEYKQAIEALDEEIKGRR